MRVGEHVSWAVSDIKFERHLAALAARGRQKVQSQIATTIVQQVAKAGGNHE